MQESYDDATAMGEDLPFIYPEAFDDESIEEKIQSVLEAKGVTIIRRAKLTEIEEDADEGLESVVFKRLDLPEEVEDEDELEGVDDKSE